MSLAIEVVDWADARAVALREAMDADTGAMYAEFLAGQTAEQAAAIAAVLTVDPSTIPYTIIAVDGDELLGHAALRPFDGKLEVKRVFTYESARGRGVATLMLADLERYALEHGVTSLILQTGPLQYAAIALYLKLGYVAIPVFGKYEAIPGALCYEKTLAQAI